MFQLQILSPTGEIYNDNVDEVSIPTQDGEISILTNHTSLYTKVDEGTVIIRKGSKETIVAVVGGFTEVNENFVTLLTEFAINAENIEKAKSIEAQKMAEELMKNKQSTAELLMAEKQLQKSLLELKVADRIRRKS